MDMAHGILQRSAHLILDPSSSRSLKDSRLLKLNELTEASIGSGANHTLLGTATLNI